MTAPSKPFAIGFVAAGGFQGVPYLQLADRMPGATTVVLDALEHNANALLADAYIRMPLFKDEGAFRARLRRAIEQHEISYVLPTTEMEQRLLAAIASTETNATYVVCSERVLDVILDKVRLNEWLRSNGVPTLPALDPGTNSVALIGKPRSGWGGRGIVHKRQDEHPPADLRTADYLWQRDLPSFVELSIDTGISLAATVVKPIIRERLRVSGGFAVVSRLVDHEAVEIAVTRLLSGLAAEGALGPFNVQVLVEPTGAFWVSDVNPRIGTSAVTTLESGRNLLQDVLFPVDGPPRTQSPGALIYRTLASHTVRPIDRPVRGVVFDLDDTLLDQKAWIRSKLDLLEDRVLSDFGSDRRRYRAVVEMLINEGPWSALIDEFVKELDLPRSAAPALIDAYRAARPESAPIYKDVVPLLRRLRSAGYKLGILTDNPRASQMQKLDASLLPALVDTIVLTDAIGARKPQRKAFSTIAESLNVPERSLVMVGNSLAKDIVGALEAGFAHGALIERRGAMFSTSDATLEACRKEFGSNSLSVIPRLSFLPKLLGADTA